MQVSYEVSESAWDKVAKDYYQEVISPLKHSSNKPIQNFLHNFQTQKKSAIDVGCGTGGLLEYITPRFKNILAVDISQNMLNQALENMQKAHPENHQHIQFKKKNMIYLGANEGQFDFVFAINSLINGKYTDLKRSFRNIPKLMKRSSHFVGVFPALESIQKEFRQTYESHLKRYQSERMAMAKTKKELEAERIESMLGLYNTDDMIQKYYTYYELKELLEEAGLKVLQLDKVEYDKEHSYNYGEKAYSTMWDWFVVAKK